MHYIINYTTTVITNTPFVTMTKTSVNSTITNNSSNTNHQININNRNHHQLPANPQELLFDKSSPTFISIIFVLGTLIFAGNAMVCYAYYKVKTLRTLTNKLVISTSVSGMFIGLLFVPFFVVLDEVTRRQIADGLVVPVSSFLASFLGFSLLFNIAALTYERYVAVFCSLRYNCLVTNARINRALIVVWMVPLLLSTLPSVLPLVVDDHVHLFIFFKLYQGFLSCILSLIILGFFAVYISVWRVSLGHIAFDRRQKFSLASTVLAEQLREFNSKMHNSGNGCDIEGQQRFASCLNRRLCFCRFCLSTSSTTSFYDDDRSKCGCCCNMNGRLSTGCLLLFNTLFNWYHKKRRPNLYCCSSCHGSGKSQDIDSTSLRMEIMPCEFDDRSHDNNVAINENDDNDEDDKNSSTSEAIGVLNKQDNNSGENRVCLVRRKVAIANRENGNASYRIIPDCDNFNDNNNINSVNSKSQNNRATIKGNSHSTFTPERFPSNLSITINDDVEDLVISQPTTPSPRLRRKRRNQNQKGRRLSESSTNTVQSPRKLSVDWQPRASMTNKFNTSRSNHGKTKDKRSRKMSAPPAFRPWVKETVAAAEGGSLPLSERHGSREEEKLSIFNFDSLVGNSKQPRCNSNNNNDDDDDDDEKRYRRLSEPNSFVKSKNRRRRRKSSVLTTPSEYLDFATHAGVDLDKVVDQLNKIGTEMEEKRKKKLNRRKTKVTAPTRQVTTFSNDEHSSSSPLLVDEDATKRRTVEEIIGAVISIECDEKFGGFNSSQNSSSYTTTSYNSSLCSTATRNSPASIASNNSCYCYRSHNNSSDRNGNGINVSPLSLDRSESPTKWLTTQSGHRQHNTGRRRRNKCCSCCCHSPNLDRHNRDDGTQQQQQHQYNNNRKSSSPRSPRGDASQSRPIQRSRVSFARCDSTSVSKLNNNGHGNSSTRSSLNRRNPTSSPQQPNNTDSNNKNQIIKGIIKKRSSNLSNNNGTLNNGFLPKDVRSFQKQSKQFYHRPTLHRQAKSMPTAAYASPSLVNQFLKRNSSFDCRNHRQILYGNHRKYSREWPNPLTPPINYNRKFCGSRDSDGLNSSNASIVTKGGMSNRKKSLSAIELPSMTSLVQTPPRSFSPLTICSCCHQKNGMMHPEDGKTLANQKIRQVEERRDSLILNRQSVWKNTVHVECRNNNNEDNINSSNNKKSSSHSAISNNDKLDSAINKCITDPVVFAKSEDVDSLKNDSSVSKETPDSSKDTKMFLSEDNVKEVVKDLIKSNHSGDYVKTGHTHLHHFVSFGNASTEVLSSWSRQESPSSSGYSSPAFRTSSFSRSVSLGEESHPSDIITVQGDTRTLETSDPNDACYYNHIINSIRKERIDSPLRVRTPTRLKKQQSIGRFPKRPSNASARRTIYSKTFNQRNGAIETYYIHDEYKTTTSKKQTRGAAALEGTGVHNKIHPDDDNANDSSCSINSNNSRPEGENNSGMKSDFIMGKTYNDVDEGGHDVCSCCCFDNCHDDEQTNLVQNSPSPSLSRNAIILGGLSAAESGNNTDQEYSPSTIASPSPSRDGVSVGGGRMESRSRYHRRFSTASALTITSRLAKSRTSIMSQAKVFLHEIKHTRVIAVIVLINALCWLPLIFLNFADATGNGHLVTPTLHLASEMVFLLNSLLMPYIYAFCKHDFKKVFAKILNDNCPCSSKRQRKRRRLSRR